MVSRAKNDHTIGKERKKKEPAIKKRTKLFKNTEPAVNKQTGSCSDSFIANQNDIAAVLLWGINPNVSVRGLNLKICASWI